MSQLLPIIEPRADFIDELLRRREELSAVERFSRANLHRDSDVPAQQRYYRHLMPATPPAPHQQYAFEVDLDKCSGCKSCVVACHTLNGLDEEEAWRRVGTVANAAEEAFSWLGNVPRSDNTVQIPHETKSAQSRIQHVTAACHHCEEPGCVAGCPVSAYEKDPVTGIVRHLDDQCIGCKYCTMMCPYEVPRYSERLGIVRKCDMCQQRLSVGEAPACVQACPNEAIAIRLVNKGETEPRLDTSGARLAPGAPASKITSPTTVYKTRYPEWFRAAIAQDHALDEVAESHAPLALMLVATQMSVGLLLCERIAAGIAWGTGQDWTMETVRLSSLLALLVAGLGLALAPLHLGQPLRAWRIFLGLRTSWLSREAVILGQYTAMLTGVVVLAWAEPLSTAFSGNSFITSGLAILPGGLAGYALLVTIPIGLAGLYSSAMIYIVTRRQLWRASRTLLRFFGSMGTCGAAGLVVVLSLEHFLRGSGLPQNGLQAALMALVVSSKLKLLWEYRVLIARRDSSDSYDQRSRVLLAGPLARWAEMRFDAGCAGLILALLLLGSACIVPQGLPPAWGLSLACASCGLLVVGEVLERLLYFSSVVYDRMPGTLK
ncbi:MAG: 4Fe-4S dicluster domain-containing protein [Planctomycetaceae bacterium]|nr:4Fe-4S dicluster domain-containing protein [Planctomycetaceae bacterium]